MAENKPQTSGWPLAALGTSGPLVVVLALLALFRVDAPPGSEPAKGKTVQVPPGEQGAGALTTSAQGRSAHFTSICSCRIGTMAGTSPPVSTSFCAAITSR